jgi:hypothetical protein
MLEIYRALKNCGMVCKNRLEAIFLDVMFSNTSPVADLETH